MLGWIIFGICAVGLVWAMFGPTILDKLYRKSSHGKKNEAPHIAMLKGKYVIAKYSSALREMRYLQYEAATRENPYWWAELYAEYISKFDTIEDARSCYQLYKQYLEDRLAKIKADKYKFIEPLE